MKQLGSLLLVILLTACSEAPVKEEASKKEEVKRIVSLSGTITEVLFALDGAAEIVGIDVTSTYPKATEKMTNLGHVRGLTAESILGVKPTHVLAFEDEMNPALKAQLESAKVSVVLFKRTYSVKGTNEVITNIADWLGKKEAAATLTSKIDKDLSRLKKLQHSPKVLFVYARGAGNLMVAGENTQLATIISMAGGKNAVSGFDDFKPLTAEAVIAANPDVLLLFDSGLSSLAAEGGVLSVPGVSATSAGENKAVISMDGQLLSGFGPRLGQAIIQLNTALSKIRL